MEKRELLFSVVFVLSLSLTLFFLGSRLTGYVVQTMYCTGPTCTGLCQDPTGACSEICRYDTDCTQGVCCDVEGKGLCRTDCVTRFSGAPKFEVKLPNFEKPQYVIPIDIAFFLTMASLVIIIGAAYYFHMIRN